MPTMQPPTPLPNLLRSRFLLLSFAVAALASIGVDVAAQSSSARPPLIRWQRTLEDALHLAKQKNLPLLVVANQDDEPACERLAAGQYHDATFANIANRYVGILCSLNRHNKVDFDAAGRRIPCPRFGCVTCGEHIAVEKALFKRYFKDNPQAPRHIGISTKGKEMFDRFLDGDLNNITRALRKNVKMTGEVPALKSSDRGDAALLKSRANTDRGEIEKRFAAADSQARLQLLKLANKSGNEHRELYRIGLRDSDAAVRRAAIDGMVAVAGVQDLILVLQSLGTLRDRADYERLLPAMDKPAKSDDTWRLAQTIRVALKGEAKAIDPAEWRKAFTERRGSEQTDLVGPEELATLDGRIEANTRKAKKSDPGGKLRLAVARDTFRYALNRLQQSQDPTFLLHDAMSALKRAEKAGAKLVETAALKARVHFLLNEPKKAGAAAEHAMTKGSAELLASGASATSLGVLEIYARDQERLVREVRTKGVAYPKAALSEAHAAYSMLNAHPQSTEIHAKLHINLLLYLGARFEAGVAIRAAVHRHAASPAIHELHRNQIEWGEGSAGLANAYDGISVGSKNEAALAWYSGYAALLAADGHVKAGARPRALPIFAKAIDSLAASGEANPAWRDSAQHWIAVAHGGVAKLHLDAARYGKAVEATVAGARARPASFAVVFSGNSLKRTCRRLRRKLGRGDEHAALLEKLNQGLQGLSIGNRP